MEENKETIHAAMRAQTGTGSMFRGPGRYAEILETFSRHIAEKGYDGTNFGDVASELRMSKGTIVHHFGNKESILAALHENYVRRRLGELERILVDLHSPEEQLAAILHALVYYQVQDRTATIAFQREIARLADRPAMAEGRVLRRRYRTLMREVVSTGIESGVFRPLDDGLIVQLLFGSAQWMWTWFSPEGKNSAEEIGAVLVDIVLGGLLFDREGLPELASVHGKAAKAMRKALRASDES